MEPESTTHDGNRQIRGLEGQLYQVYKKISDVKSRIWLIRNLMSKDLATRDIISFLEGQMELRSEIKILDKKTMRSAMKTKLADLKKVLTKAINTQIKLEDNLGWDNNKKKLARNKFKKDNKESKAKKNKKFVAKIEHYSRKQCVLGNSGARKKHQKTTQPPSSMMDLKELSIFKSNKDLPNKESPIGPFICDKDIKLSKDELRVLVRDPKYSVIKRPKQEEFHIEVEKSLCKHRYGANNRKKERCTLSEILRNQSEGKQKIIGRGKITEEERKREINKKWAESKHKYVFDPLTRIVDFSDRRPSDYKLNKTVHLPKPLESQEEFHCELRRREFLATFDEFNENLLKTRKNKTHDVRRKKKVNSKGKGDKYSNGPTESNLSWSELRGLKSLKNKIKMMKWSLLRRTNRRDLLLCQSSSIYKQEKFIQIKTVR